MLAGGFRCLERCFSSSLEALKAIDRTHISIEKQIHTHKKKLFMQLKINNSLLRQLSNNQRLAAQKQTVEKHFADSWGACSLCFVQV